MLVWLSRLINTSLGDGPWGTPSWTGVSQSATGGVPLQATEEQLLAQSCRTSSHLLLTHHHNAHQNLVRWYGIIWYAHHPPTCRKPSPLVHIYPKVYKSYIWCTFPVISVCPVYSYSPSPNPKRGDAFSKRTHLNAKKQQLHSIKLSQQIVRVE